MRFWSLFVVTILFLCAATSAQATVVMKDISYQDGDVMLKGTLAYDDSISGKKPGILLFPEWWGKNDYAERRAKEIAEQGYIVFVADMYGNAKVTKNATEAKELSAAFYENRNLMRRRARLALDTLKKQEHVHKSNIAAVGFCMGGTVAIELARTGVALKGVAAFHAGLQFPEEVAKGKVKAKILVMNGAADPMVSFEENKHFIEEMQESGADVQLALYSGAMHAFTNPSANTFHIKGVAYNAKAEERSFNALHGFFNEIFARQ